MSLTARMLSEECRLLFKQAPLLKTPTHFFLFCSTTDATLVIIFKPYHSYKLQFSLPSKRFYIRVSLLDYMFATANEHSLPRFYELLFVWPLPFDLPGMSDLIK